jgi:hypothetical protein
MGTQKANKNPGAKKRTIRNQRMIMENVFKEGTGKPEVQHVGMEIHYDSTKNKGNVDIETNINGKKTSKHMPFNKSDLEKLFNVVPEPDFLHERLLRDFPPAPPPLLLIEAANIPIHKNMSKKNKGRKPVYLDTKRPFRKARRKRTRGKRRRVANPYTQTQGI